MTNYKVQPGDTLDTISKKMGVPPTAISGYKSQDPNLIMPGEELTIANLPTSTTPKLRTFQVPGAQPAPTVPQPVATTVPSLMQQAQLIPTIAPAPQPTSTGQIPPIAPEQTPTLPQAPTSTVATAKVLRTFNLPSGNQIQMEVTPETDTLLGGEATRNKPIESETADKQVSNFFSQYGVDSNKLSTGFTQNPIQTLTTLTDHIMQSMNIPSAIMNISNITKQIEDLSNERDDEIQKIQDNPWKSAGSKSDLIAKIQDKYEKRIANRTNSLTLLQNAYQDARQQAQFAITTAVGLYDKQRAFDQNAIKDALDREEARAKTTLDTKKFEEDKRQFGLEYALKQQELGIKEAKAGTNVAGRPTKVSNKEITDINDTIIASTSLTSIIDKFLKNIDKYGTQTLYGKGAGERESLKTSLLLSMKNLEKTGALDKGTIDVLAGTIPSSEFFATEAFQKAKLQELKDVVSGKVTEYVDSYRGTTAETDPRVKRAFVEQEKSSGTFKSPSGQTYKLPF